MVKNIKMYWKRVVASILVVTMLCTSVSLESLAMDSTAVTQKEEQKNEETREETNGEYQIRKEDVIEEKRTTDTTTYDAGNGLLVTEYYAQPVRFEDESGKLVDYDPSLVKISKEKSKKGEKLEGYSYENNKGDKKHYFPENLTEKTPILMENENYQIKFVPIEMPVVDTASEVQVEDSLQPAADAMEEKSDVESTEEMVESAEAEIAIESEELQTVEETTSEEEITVIETEEAELKEDTVMDIYEEESLQDIKTSYLGVDGKTTYQYTSLEQGVKEEIILEEKPETNQFAFLLEIPGLSIRKNALDEGITLYDGDDIVAGIQAPYMNDATGEAYSENLSYTIEAADEEAGIYKIVLTVDESYLNAQERVYPVTIDPTVTWDTNSEMSEVYILSEYPSTNFYDSGIVSFYLGYGSQGKSRAYFKFNKISNVKGKYIKSAKMTLKECSNSQSGKKIYAHRIITSWDKTTIKWNKRPTYKNASFASFTSKGPGGTPSMDFTALIQGYANGDYENHGIVLMNANETSNTGFTKFYGMRHSTTSYRPKLKIEYYTKPTTATSVKPSPKYVKAGDKVKITWTGITSSELDYINYRLAEYDSEAKSEISVIKAYSEDTKIGTTASGSAELLIGDDVPEGEYKTYKINVRGVATTGATGIGKITYFNVDNANPTGSIKVLAAGTAEETNILQDTVQIVGEVDGTGSPVKTSSIKLYDKEGTFIKDIYTNATESRTEPFYVDIPNGEYVLKLTVEDTVGFTTEVTKDVTVVNKLSAPTMKKTYTNDNTAKISWEIPDNGTDIKGIAYKLAEATEWTEINDISDNKGSFEVSLPEEEGTYVVQVCGIDEVGNYGVEASVKCVVDKTLPIVQIHEVDRGMIYASASDSNFSNWTITLKTEDSETGEELHSGKGVLDNEYIGFLDMSKLETGVTYDLVLTGTDKAGNESSFTLKQTRTENEVVAEHVEPVFRVKRPSYSGQSQTHIVFPSNISKLELATIGGMTSIPEGTTRWYLDGELVSSENIWNKNLPTEEGKNYSILSVIENNTGVYYSQRMIKNRMLIPVTTGLIMQLPDNCVSFRLNTGESNSSATVHLDNGSDSITVESGTTYHVSQISNGEKATASTILVSVAADTDTSGWVIEADSVLGETFELSSIENYHPYELSADDGLNYKTYLNWQGIEGTYPESISYEIYRDNEANFEPSEDNLIAKDIKANYWAEMNVSYARTFYYKIRAVEKDSSGNITKASSYSNELPSRVIDVDEYVKRLGIKEYWEYAEFDTPSGNGYIEKSKGNLAYTQTDTEIPNEQLPVVLERTYNSQSTAKTAFGTGWTHSFDLELLNICKDNSLDFNNIVFKDGNGTLYLFNKNAEGKYISSMGKYITLEKKDETKTYYLPDNEKIGVENKEKKVEIATAFVMATKDNVKYYYNSSGQLVSLEEANGNYILFEHEPAKGRLTKVTTSKNLTMEFVYFTDEDYADSDTTDLLTVKEIRLPDQSKMCYEYSNSRLSKVTKVGTDGKSTISWNHGYDDAKQLISISDACNNIYNISYTGEKATKVVYPNNEAIVLEYADGGGSTTTYKEVVENGETERILLETNTFQTSSGNSKTMKDSLGNSVSYEYTDNLRSKETYSMTYYEIEEGRIVEKQTTKSDTTKYTDDENVESETDEDGITEAYTYVGGTSKIAHLPATYTETNKEGTVITDEEYKYDDNGNLIRRYDKVSGMVVETTYYEEDNAETGALKGEIKSEKEYYLEDEANKTTTDTTYTYNSSGEKTEVITETSGQYTVKTTNVYDVMGRQKSSTDTLGVTTTTEFDPFGRVSKVTVKQGDIEDVVTREYDSNGTLLKEVAEDGTIYTYTYDNMNRVISESVTNEDNTDTWTTEYTNGSVEINTGKGKEVIDHVFITTEKNPEGDVLAVTYTDTLGRIVRQMQSGLYVDYTYDREDHVITTCQLGTNPNNENPVVMVNLYDEKGYMSGQVIKPSYDALTDQFVIEEDSLTQTAVYDSIGNMISATDGMVECGGNVTPPCDTICIQKEICKCQATIQNTQKK